MKTGYKVGDAITKNPITIKASASLKQCADLMAKKHIGSLLVEEKGNIVGILSEQDIVRKAVAKGTAGKSLVTITPDKDLFDAIRVMRDHNIRHLPVMYKNKFLGLITMKDILKLEPDLFDLLVAKFEVREERKILRAEADEGVCELCGEYAKEIQSVEGINVCPNCEDEL